MASQELEVKLLGRRFTLRCADGELESLKQAAATLEHKLEQLQGNHSAKDLEQQALLVALNLSHDLLLEQNRTEAITRSMESRIKTLQATVERALKNPRDPSTSTICESQSEAKGLSSV